MTHEEGNQSYSKRKWGTAPKMNNNRALDAMLSMIVGMSAISCQGDGGSENSSGFAIGESEGSTQGAGDPNDGNSEGGEGEGGEGDGSEDDGGGEEAGSDDENETTSDGGGGSVGDEESGGDGEAPIAQPFEPCTIDISNVGESCSGVDPSTCDGADIAQNYSMWPDPYACYVCGDGVTLLKGSACETQGVELVWNEEREQCILNGQGYPIEAAHTCSNGYYSEGIAPEKYNELVSKWHEIATIKGNAVFQENAGADAYVVDLTLENGEMVQAAVSMGHGVLDGKCGDTFLIRNQDSYVLLLQTDVRAWSLELSPGANTWLDSSNVGGTCIIPEVRRIDASFVIDQFF